METTKTRKPVGPAEYDVEDDDELYVTRMPSSTRRYRSAPPVQPSTEPDTQGGVLI